MLTPAEIAALRNLADKKSGTLTAFVKIADARRLTELGLAQRSQQGWDITSEGVAYLAAVGPEEGDAASRPPAQPQALREVPATPDSATESGSEPDLPAPPE